MPSLPSLPSHLALPTTAQKWRTRFFKSLNFYRIHLLAFTIIPLILSGIMYGANTEYHIDYVDCLFCCMSAMTVTGLATINLSTLSAFQQFLLFFQMIIGSLTFVSILMIVVRQYFFRQTFKHVLQERQARSKGFRFSKTFSRVGTIGAPVSAIRKKFSGLTTKDKRVKDVKEGTDEGRTSTPSLVMQPITAAPPSPKGSHHKSSAKKHDTKKKGHKKINPDMIKRVSGGGVGLVNPMGWYDGERTQIKTPAPTPEHIDDVPLPLENGGVLGLSLDDGRGVQSGQQLNNALEKAVEDGKASVIDDDHPVTQSPGQLTPEENVEGRGLPPSPRRRVPYAGLQLADDAFPRSKTIAFDDEQADYQDPKGATTQREGGGFPRSATFRSAAGGDRLPREPTLQSGNFPRTYTLRPTVSHRPDPRMSGFGGFPTPFEIGKRLFRKAFPRTTNNLTKSLTMAKTMTVPRTNTTAGRGSIAAASGNEKEVPYISFAAVVGRNSMFHSLTTEQMDELGGVEYRALRVLLYIVVGYFIFFQLAAFVIIAPYISAQGRYDHVFEAQPRMVQIPWFALFQSVSAFSNTGMSLCDTSMVPFQGAYLMIVVMFICIFAGNTAFVTDLSLLISSYLVYKLVPQSSRASESLRFLLDHPRRCFVYLFPSTQTWVLMLVLITLTSIDWVSFLVLDIGTPAIESIPVGTRVAVGLLQSAAVRAAGFSTVALGALAPAVKVLYVIMMYVSVYPIALSVRATNVYEEKSLGLFGEEDDDEYGAEGEGEGAQAVAKYIGWHARRQLAFDIWWLGFALWLICIIERGHINNEEDNFNIFNVIFELVSAYGTVGLSLGVTYDNFSFSGGFRKLSKLIMVLVMLRGKHRGLPVAIDRAVMLPKDFTAAEETAFEEERSRRASRRGSMFEGDVLSTRRGSFTTLSGMAGAAERELSPIHGPNTALPGQHHHHHLPGQPGSHHIHHSSPNPNSSHHRSTSFGGSLPVPGSPSSNFSAATSGGADRGSLQFSLPRVESLERPNTMGMRNFRPGAAVSGSLTPVKESSMSRNPTIVPQQDSLDDSAIV
ncbi:potassium ion transporter [Kwoniella mangroviensis CBS 8886]|nr:potassium ion transporter [Kwoniella mangroviensis CBS 8507]OCF63318.1 potassium ion transporter [Kwoniella mangroviensis CBS 8507]OCF73744.1 potassium ion transporter [Kwoniella mangroviensis CBS 8886]